MQSRTCPRCGLNQEQWDDNEGRGFEEEGRYFCCEGCAEKSGCTCRSNDHSATEPDPDFIEDKRGPEGSPLPQGRNAEPVAAYNHRFERN